MASNRNMPSCCLSSSIEAKPRARSLPLRAISRSTRSAGFPRTTSSRRKLAARGQSVLDEKRSFARDLELASDAGRKGGRSSGGTFANDHAVGKLRILRILSGNRNGLESPPFVRFYLRLRKECIQHCGSSRVLWFKSTSNRRGESARNQNARAELPSIEGRWK